MDLLSRKCAPKEDGMEPFSLAEAEDYHKAVSDWHLTDEVIWREIEFKDFVSAIAFINELAKLAETEGHHPDIYLSYNKLKLELSTHTIGGLSENDFIMAAKTSRLLDENKILLK